MWIGLLIALISSILSGSAFVPIKNTPSGDGFTSQLFMCIGSFMVATFVHSLLNFPPIQPLAMVGGALWCIANVFSLQIMNRLGMGLSVLVCSTLACLTGWATSRFGVCGLPAAIPADLVMNYMGMTALVGGYAHITSIVCF
ncbi:hypothetical protein OESDEN_09828 [Oesophagostomum dentatum]|uniref:Uncharacterized protein n=1 Tax=Oesophagostomum dentatum TaxID=61180 RepID=A0A0B1SZB6_OESDE|nr:hypothetical protein OESDEN_09828 [Oesophagostomum dentatum]